MTYKELTIHAHKKFSNELNYGMLGRLKRTYKLEFIARCIDQYPENKMGLDGQRRATYLTGLCNQLAADADFAGKPIEFL